MIGDYGFVKVAAASPVLKVADPSYNIEEIERMIDKVEGMGVSVLVFPEMSVTAYTCGDLFGQDLLLDSSDSAVERLRAFSQGRQILIFVGAPVRAGGHYLFNCALAIQNGRILGIIPKTYIPNYNEFYEKRWFSPAQASVNDEIEFCGTSVPFGTDILLQDEGMPELRIGAEICEDLWSPIPPSSYAAISGATLLVNLSASNELVNKASYRLELVKQQSARLIAGYVYSSSGVFESTTDLVFGGHLIIAENGAILAQSKRFERESSIETTEIDVRRLSSERRRDLTFRDSADVKGREFRCVRYSQPGIKTERLSRSINPYPFVPPSGSSMDDRCSEIFSIQVAGLAKRIQFTGCSGAVVGISGGLDSTLALLVAAKTFDALHLPRKRIHAITMPGFGTTDRTHNNSINLCRILNVHLQEISIVGASLQHFRDIGQDPDTRDVTYENSQARERTQILMDIANKVGGIVIGTGDLSEIALGWSTYNGDHMSMYAVNCSVPKTLVRYLIGWVSANEIEHEASDVLADILDTPVSPELLPADSNGDIAQKTEEIIGPYELHDFFLYHMIRYDESPKKILYLAGIAFKDKYSDAEIKKWLKYFCRRFFSQQFKRSCMPDGPKVGTVGLSPRGDWRMPSDASSSVWLDELN